ncbi:Acyl-[acyl-carrier-protein] desaturase, chloroplastic [Capsicum annuum]|uniref:Acyl-[acyl-carrier-protein] desaturase, chloroplastic n=2 Tax=Capsicum annuum TaxID=4072 RepID=A0A2G3AIR7_CAPAN|nr:Acyl-[acyl-carrier-protein] desaturase, chloroplastic [Capsicum annuum]
MAPEKLEVFISSEFWVSESVLHFSKPVEKCWQPSEFLPEASQGPDGFMKEVRALRERTIGLPDEYFVIFVGNMLTEDSLPTYQTVINTWVGVRDATESSSCPWAIWTRAWAAEENRHGHLLRTYIYLSGRVNMMIEKTMQYLIGAGMDNGTESKPYMGLMYSSFQERATFLSHGNMARLAKEAGDPVLVRLCGTIAANEKRHENAYTKIIEKLVEVDPNATVLAVENMMKKRTVMPHHLISDGQDSNLYEHFSAVSHRMGVYITRDYAEIIDFFITRWKLEKLDEAEERSAQDFVCKFPFEVWKLEIESRNQICIK